MNVLVINAGSSSLKFQLIATDPEKVERDRDTRLCRGEVEGFGPHANFQFRGGTIDKEASIDLPDMHAAVEEVLRSTASISDIDALGHRVVHGGEKFSESVVIDDAVLQAIEQNIELAPLHNLASVEGIRAARAFFGPGKPQVAVFDTAFHHTIPKHAYIYAIPYEFYEKYRMRRYGFHGTSHRYVADRYRALKQISGKETNIVSLHLGNGCSAAAIRRGKSVDTSMGMTPLEGLMMGTRSGDIDPALVTLIANQENISAEDVEKMLNTCSGLLGVSGTSGDMRSLAENSEDPQARLAIEMFCYRVRKYIGAYLTICDADAVVFTGGIGENAAEIRARVCDGLEFAGLTIDPAKNQASTPQDREISTSASTLAAWCIHTDEELLIARDTMRCVLRLPRASY